MFVTMNLKLLLLGLAVLGAVYAQPLSQSMARVQGGTYRMGDAVGVGNENELPVREVTVSDFEIQRTEVTQGQFAAFCAATWRRLPSDFGWGRADSLPAVGVSWYDAILYCNWLSTTKGYTPCYTIDKLLKDPNNLAVMDVEKWTVTCDWSANGYRLPTEAEWEYAARGGSYPQPHPGAGSVVPDSIAWYALNSNYRTHPVAMKRPNNAGVFDLTGNVAEWCWDWMSSEYNPSETQNPTGNKAGKDRVVRGGNWMEQPNNLRNSYRTGHMPADQQLNFVGFRVVRRL